MGCCKSREARIDNILDASHTCRITVKKVKVADEQWTDDEEAILTRRYQFQFHFCDRRYMQAPAKGWTDAEALDNIKIFWVKNAPKKHFSYCPVGIDLFCKATPVK